MTIWQRIDYRLFMIWKKYVCEGGAKMKMALVKPVEGNANTDNWLDLYGEAGGGCGFGCGLDW